jgi:DNA-binding NarL/FixJ family response regulator
MPQRLRILIVEDHALVSDALDGVVRQLASSVKVATADSAEAAVVELKKNPGVDLVLLDLGLPGARGRAAFDLVAAHCGKAPVVIVTGAAPTAEALDLLRAGARGYVHKRASVAELVTSLRFVLQGGTIIPPSVLTAGPGSAVHLTHRQREVLTLLARGAANKDIAQALNIAEATVRVHVASIMRALDVENRTQAATSPLGRQLADGD